MTADPSDPTRTEPYTDVDDNTDGAAAFERATRAAQALADLPPAPTEAVPEHPASEPAPLQLVRVVVLLAVVGLVWLGTMLWERIGG